MACLTVATITSPTPAYRRCDPPRTRMQRISRAPVLSATRRRVSVWIIAPSGSSRPLQDLGETPALRLAERATLDQAHRVALVRLVALVVRVQRRGRADDLLVLKVAASIVGTDGDYLIGISL